MPAADGYFVLSVANDPTFERFCEVADCRHLLENERFATAVERVRNRDEVTDTLNEVTRTRPVAWWLERLEAAGVGNGAVNTLEEVFADPQVKAREMVIEMDHPATGGRPAKLIASPIKLSGTPVTYRQAPPTLGQHTDEVLAERLALDGEALRDLRDRGII